MLAWVKQPRPLGALPEGIVAVGSIVRVPAGTEVEIRYGRGLLEPFTGLVRLQDDVDIGPISSDWLANLRGELIEAYAADVRTGGAAIALSGTGVWAYDDVAGQVFNLSPKDRVIVYQRTRVQVLYGAPGTTVGTMPCAGIAEVRQSDGSCVAPPCPGNQVRLRSGDCGCPPGYTKTGAGICNPMPCPQTGQVRQPDGSCGCPQEPGWFTMPDGTCVAGGCPTGYTAQPDGTCAPAPATLLSEEPWYKKTSTWLLIGGGVVVTGLLVWAASRKKSMSTGGFAGRKFREVAKYSDPSAAHEFALKLQRKGWSSIQIRKQEGRWVVSGVAPEEKSTSTGGFGDTTELLDAISGEGFTDETAGSVIETGRWYGLIRGPLEPGQMTKNFPEEWASLDEDEKREAATAAGFILTEDSRGFKDSAVFADEKALNEKWNEIEAEQAAFYQEEE